MANRFTDACANIVRGIDSTQKMVLWVLCQHTSNEDGTCYPSFSRLGKFTMLGRMTVNRSLRKLIELGLISIVGKVKHTNGQLTNKYQVHLDKLVELKPEPKQLTHLAGSIATELPSEQTSVANPQANASSIATELPVVSQRYPNSLLNSLLSAPLVSVESIESRFESQEGEKEKAKAKTPEVQGQAQGTSGNLLKSPPIALTPLTAENYITADAIYAVATKISGYTKAISIAYSVCRQQWRKYLSWIAKTKRKPISPEEWVTKWLLEDQYRLPKIIEKMEGHPHEIPYEEVVAFLAHEQMVERALAIFAAPTKPEDEWLEWPEAEEIVDEGDCYDEGDYEDDVDGAMELPLFDEGIIEVTDPSVFEYLEQMKRRADNHEALLTAWNKYKERNDQTFQPAARFLVTPQNHGIRGQQQLYSDRVNDASG